MKFIIETYGCQMNVSDSELVTSILINSGWEETRDIGEADLILFNTCSVRKHAEDRVLGRIANERCRKLEKPGLRIGVLGCMAQRLGKRLLQNELGVDLVVGVDQYSKLPSLLDSVLNVSVDFDSSQIYPGLAPKHQSDTCAYITITRGCNNFCSYCIVPYVRGRERSVPVNDIVAEVKRCIKTGLRDITLLGQNVNSYYHDGHDFASLLRILDNIDGFYRIRFITSHPKDLSKRLIAAMAECSKVCNHIHLPLQSGANEILAAMNRNYSIEHYLGLVENLRNAMPDIAITTDLIAGFPGENDRMFAQTLDAMRHIGFDYAFCFKYSERDGTAALTLEKPVPEAVRLLRLQEMIALQSGITLSKFRAQIGSKVEVYVESLSKKSAAKVSGKTRDYKIAVLSGKVSEIGTIKTANVVDATAGTLICE